MAKVLWVLLLSLPLLGAAALSALLFLMMSEKGIRADLVLSFLFFSGIAAVLVWRLTRAFHKDGGELSLSPNLTLSQRKKIGSFILATTWIILAVIAIAWALPLDGQAAPLIAFGILAVLVASWLVRVIVLFIRFPKG